MSNLKIDQQTKVPSNSEIVSEKKNTPPISFRLDGHRVEGKNLKQRVESLQRSDHPESKQPSDPGKPTMRFDDCAYATAFSSWNKN